MNRNDVCLVLQEIGLPAVRVKPVSAEVIEFNALFSALFEAAAPLEYRDSFVERVLPCIVEADRDRWESSFTGQTPVQVLVAFGSDKGSVLDFEMRSVVSPGPQKLDDSILCVFTPIARPIVERIGNAHLLEGQELERQRIRNELHRGVSQQLLGAAFGCKVLAGKIAKLSEGLGQEAADLASLLNEAVVELQTLVRSTEDR